MTLPPVNAVHVKGTGPAAALCAAALAQMRSRLGFTVSADLSRAESPQPPVILGPQSQKLLKALGLNERDLIKACAGTFAVSAKFEGGNACPFITSAPVTNGVALHQIHGAGKTGEPYSQYFTPAHMTGPGLFSHPDISDDYRYSVVLDAGLFEHYMHRAAAHYGCKEAPAASADLTVKAQHNSGAQTVQTPDVTMPVCLSYDLTKTGVTAKAVTQSHKYVMKTDVTATQKQTAVWDGDVIDAGHGLAGLHALDHSYMDALAFSLQSLFNVWPASADTALARNEFNRRTGSFIARAVDYQAAPMILAGHRARDSASPELAVKLTQFLSRGRLVSFDDEPVSDAEWTAYMLAAGAKPGRTDPLASQFSAAQIEDILSGRRQAAKKRAADMRSQTDYLRASDALTGNVQRAAS